MFFLFFQTDIFLFYGNPASGSVGSTGGSTGGWLGVGVVVELVEELL